MNLCRVGTHVFKALNILWFQSCYFLTPLKEKCFKLFGFSYSLASWKISPFIIFQYAFEKDTHAVWLCFTLHPVCHSRLERKWHQGTPFLPSCGTAPLFDADTADSAEMIKGSGNLWGEEHRILSVWTTCQNFKVIRSWAKKKECGCLELGRISMWCIFLLRFFLSGMNSLRKLKTLSSIGRKKIICVVS